MENNRTNPADNAHDKDEIIGIIEEYLSQAGIAGRDYKELVNEQKLIDTIIEQSKF